MKIATEIRSAEEMHFLLDLGFSEFILAPKMLSRKGTLSLEETNLLLEEGRRKEVHLSIQSDLIVSENHFETIHKAIIDLSLSQATALRVQDLGLAHFLGRNLPNRPLHLILETGNRNQEGIQALESSFEKVNRRTLLSHEIPKHSLKTILGKNPSFKTQSNKAQPKERELLLLGPLLLFFSPRSLLSPVFPPSLFENRESSNKDEGEDLNERREAKAWSQELPQKDPFTVFENEHGTFLYYPKDLCLLDHFLELSDYGLQVGRVDRDFLPSLHVFSSLRDFFLHPTKQHLQKVKELWPRKVLHGFYEGNKTDSKFTRLKNPMRALRDESFCAEVIESVSSSHLVLHSKKLLQEGDKVCFLTPVGKKIKTHLHSLRRMDHTPVIKIPEGELCILPYKKGITPQTYLYFF